MEPNWSTVPPLTLPASPVSGGFETTYIGQVKLHGQTVAASVSVNQKEAICAWDGIVHKVSDYKILTGEGYKWKEATIDSIPANAVTCGKLKEGDNLYIGRGVYKNNMTVGTVHPGKRCLLIPYGREEVQLQTFEVLIDKRQKKDILQKLKRSGSRVLKLIKRAEQPPKDQQQDKELVAENAQETEVSAEKWRKATFDTIPTDAVLAGHDENGQTIYIGRATHEDEMLPATIIPSKKICQLNYKGEEILATEFEVWCAPAYAWMKPTGDGLPPKTVDVGKSAEGAPKYLGRAEYKNCLKPGILSEDHKNISIFFEGKFIAVDEFEVLVET